MSTASAARLREMAAQVRAGKCGLLDAQDAEDLETAAEHLEGRAEVRRGSAPLELRNLAHWLDSPEAPQVRVEGQTAGVLLRRIATAVDGAYSMDRR